MTDRPAGDPVGAGAADGDDLVQDAQGFIADEAALLVGLASVLDELAAAEAAEAEAFDTDAMWDRVAGLLWPDDRPPRR